MRLVLFFFILILLACSEKKEIKICIQPYSGFDQTLADTVLKALKVTYHAKVYILKPINIPQKAFINIKSPRYRADEIIENLKSQKPDSVNYVLALTTQDISFTKKEGDQVKEPRSKYEDWGIFGLGYQPGSSCVVSTFRLNNKGRTILVERLKKVAIHEIGHNMGLKHCESTSCVMKDAAESIKTVDTVSLLLCKNCSRKLN